ncbi:toast rack family protein [Evansella sp. AB-rgal1]|uniref:toast rack family protein n=1 Tax=Evansella sp. AB-rgal1 TaxID=3242696 RepID=UPI00359E4A92
MKKLVIMVCMIGIALMLLSACGLVNPVNAIMGNTVNKEIVVEKDAAESLDINIDLGVGNLEITGGAEEWVTGEMEYTRSKLKSQLSYNLKHGVGEVSIEQKRSGNFFNSFGKQKTNWDIQLSNDIPMDLHINAGVSDTTLDLRGVQITNLTVDAGVGDIKVDLSGDWTNSFNTTIHTGVGDTKVVLPKHVGVKVVSKKGLGSANFPGFKSLGNNEYVNDAYESAEVVITLNVETGVGDSSFQLQ